MSLTHWKKLFNPDYLGAYSLCDEATGEYRDVVLTIKSVAVERITGADGKKEDCPVMRFAEGAKPMVLNVTNAKTLEKLFKSKHYETWYGRRVQVGVESVKAFGDVVDALRIRKFLPREDGPVVCANCGGEVAEAGEMSAVQVAAYSRKRFGRTLCAECARKAKEQQDAGKEVDSDADQDDAPAAD